MHINDVISTQTRFYTMHINDVISTQTRFYTYAFIFLNISYVFKDKIAGN